MTTGGSGRGGSAPGVADVFLEQHGFRILRALRRIIRAVDLYSRRVDLEHHVTTPQLLCLYALAKAPGSTLTALSREVSLSASTVTGIVERLDAKGLVRSERVKEDRRRVRLMLTAAGRKRIAEAPVLLQDRLSSELRRLSELEQATIARSLERVVKLMGAEDVEASPNLLPSANVEPVRRPKGMNRVAKPTETHS